MKGVIKGNTGRRLSSCAALLVAVVAATAANQPARPDAKASSAAVKNLTTMSVNILPNGSVPAHATCNWTATVSGGVAPYHYAWTANNAPVGSDSPNLSYTNNGGAFRILVNVTDQNGDFASDSNIMTIGGTFC